MTLTTLPTMLLRVCFFSLLAITATASANELQQHDIRVDGMTCPFCVATSERALKKLDGVQSVATDLENGKISVCTDNQVRFNEKQLKQLFLRNGFTFRSVTSVAGCSIVENGKAKSANHDHDHHHTEGKGHH